MNRSRATCAALTVAVAVLVACAGSGAPLPGGASSEPSPSNAGRTGGDTVDAALVPPGFGTLRQDDISVRLQYQGVSVRILPLEESVIRLLSSDSYRALHELKESRRPEAEAIARRANLSRYSLWYVSFFGMQQGEARYSPNEVVIENLGREYRPADVIPLTQGFGDQRLRQRETQSAVYVFDGSLDLAQPLTVRVETEQSTSWAGTARVIERERALVRSRSGAPSAQPTTPPR